MKKAIKVISVLLGLNLFGCGGGSYLEYDEELVRIEALEYLEDKYGGEYEFRNSGSPGDSDFVRITFKDLSKSDEKGTTLITVTWSEDSGISNDSVDYIPKGMEYDENLVKKEALSYLEEKYNYKFEFMWCNAYTDYVGVTFNLLDDTKQNTVTVKWYEDGTMTDNLNE